MEVWHVRHGERADEVSGIEKTCWKKTPIYREGRYYDPPLTRFGHVQASSAGVYLRSLPFNKDTDREESGFDRVCTSPLLRAVQTAYCISRELGGLPIQVVPGLCACTAALARIGFVNTTLMEDSDIRDAFPDANVVERDPYAPRSFYGACSWLANQPRKRVLAVGHREGTKGLAGRKVPTPHCCIGVFRPCSTIPPSFVLDRLLSHKGHSLERRTGDFSGEDRLETHDVAGWSTREPSSSDGFLTGDRWLRQTRKGKSIAHSGADRHRYLGHLKDDPTRRLEANPVTKSLGTTAGNLTAGTFGGPCGTSNGTGRGLKDGGETAARRGGIEGAGTGSSGTTQSRKLPEASRKCSKLLDLAPDALWGPTGVLSYLDPKELCLAKTICKRMSPAVENDALWRGIFLLLPEKLRREPSARSGTDGVVGTSLPIEGHYKTRFLTIVASRITFRSMRAARKIAREQRRLGVIHGLRRAVEVLDPTLITCLNGKDVGLVDSIGTRLGGWASRANILTEPSSRRGMRIFSLSSSMKIDVPPSVTLPQLRSVRTLLARPDLDWLSAPLLTVDNPHLKKRHRVLGKCRGGFLTLLEIPCNRSFEAIRGRRRGPPEPRGIIVAGVLDNTGVGGEHVDAAVCLMTLHMPHQLILNSSTRTMKNRLRRSQNYGHDSAGALYGFENLGAAIGLRTAAVPLWETCSVGVVTGYISSRDISVRGTLSSGSLPPSNFKVIRLDLVSPGASDSGGAHGEARSLSGPPNMPFTTTGGLSGVVEDVLLADFALFDCHGDSLWSFTSSIVFTTPRIRNWVGGAEQQVLDISRSEVVKERRQGLVEEDGVGRVVIELALVDSPEKAGTGLRLLGRSSTEHEWIVRSAWVELELNVLDGWFGSKHGRKQT